MLIYYLNPYFFYIPVFENDLKFKKYKFIIYKMCFYKDYFNTLINFSICNALTNKILSIIFSLTKFGLYLAGFLIFKNWNEENKTLKSITIFQFVFEIIPLLTSIFMIIFSRYLNRKSLYLIFRILTIIIIIYIFISSIMNICLFITIKFKQFPDLYALDKDLIYDSSEKELNPLKGFLKGNKVNISELNIFNFTHLEQKNDYIYVPDPNYFKIIYANSKKYRDLTPFEDRYEFKYTKAMKLRLANIILDIFSIFLWNSIKYKHEKLIQNSVYKKYGRKIVYAGYGRFILSFAIYHDEVKEEEAINEIRNNDDLILSSDVDYWWLINIIDKIGFYGALIFFIKLIVQRSKMKFIKKAIHFPFLLTFYGDGLYFNLILFLIINFGIDLIFLSRLNICTNHHSNLNNNNCKCCPCLILFTIGLIYLFFTICGILGSLIFLSAEIGSNGNIYFTVSNKNILFQFSDKFELDYNRDISYYIIIIKKISKSDKAKNIATLLVLFLIYFCQFYIILIDKIYYFNCESKKFGKCLINDYIKHDESELVIDDYNPVIQNNEKFYKNFINDDYFHKLNNNNTEKKANTINIRNNLPRIENNVNRNIQTINRNNRLPPINPEVLRINSN